VLDGQQRLSSIYAVFSNKTKQDVATEQYNPNLNIFEIYYDFKKEQFIAGSEVPSNCDYAIHLKNLIDTTKLIPSLAQLDKNYHTQASELCSKFLNYEIPVVTIKYRSKEEVGMIFERINNTGTRLTTVDLMTAWTWTDDFHLLEATNELTEELDEKGFGEIPYSLIIQAISGVIQDDTTSQAVLKLNGETVRDIWPSFCDSIKKAIDFLATDLSCIHSDFLPYVQQLVALTKFFSIDGQVKSAHLELLRKWFWRTSFSNRYSTGQTTNKMNVDIATIKEIRKDNVTAIQSYSYSVTKAELISTKFSKANPLTRAFLLLNAQFKPVDLVKNSPVDLGRALSEYNRKEFHHVFPKAYLKEQRVPDNRINSTLNFCFLPSDSNKKISRKEPSDYFFSLVEQANFNTVLDSNLLPVNQLIYKQNDFVTFLDKRGDLIISILDKITN
jgi:hypothetical protein